MICLEDILAIGACVEFLMYVSKDSINCVIFCSKQSYKIYTYQK